ncbi:MAG: UDP-N-acetylmuramate--L-alanine ligase [Bacteroidota bacterium]
MANPLDNIRLENLRVMYFIGIGGIGMSALARYYNKRGVRVYGYDRTETSLTKTLVNEGMTIHYQEDLNQIPEGVDLVIYTPAVPDTHAELAFFRKLGYPVLKRAALLGLISRHSKTIAIAGTHGKTTTSTMLTHLLRVGGVDCTAFLGGISKNYGSNYVSGESDWVVAEADEYDRSFLHLRPYVAAILSIDPDHLDIYGDHASMLDSGFGAFAGQVQETLFMHSQIEEPLSGGRQTIKVGSGDHPGIRVEQVIIKDGTFHFDLVVDEQRLEQLALGLPGRHNVENAAVASAIALQAGVSPADLRKGLASFSGILRRFDRLINDPKVAYIDDYAHHPTELTAAIEAARDLYPGRKITGIFQPHLYSRTQDFQKGFAKALDLLDETILLDIYPARELPIPGVESGIVLERMKNEKKQWLAKEEVMTWLANHDTDVLLTLGAGDIDTLVEPIKALLVQKYL